jgi:hypothetical protein
MQLGWPRSVDAALGDSALKSSDASADFLLPDLFLLPDFLAIITLTEQR